MLRSVVGLFAGPVSVAEWVKVLSPVAVAQFYFSSYNGILSNLAIGQLLDEEFPAEGEAAPAVGTVANLQAALNELYPGNTCEVSRQDGKMRVAITVPGGAAGGWPSQIPEPRTITHPNGGKGA